MLNLIMLNKKKKKIIRTQILRLTRKVSVRNYWLF